MGLKCLIFVFILVSYFRFSKGSELEDALAYLKTHRESFKAELLQLAAIASVSANPKKAKECLEAAHWLETRMKKAGLQNVQLVSTATAHQPVVYGDWLHAKGMPTVLIYGHYDVQPAEDIELWEFPPFEPRIRDGYFIGRGTDDDKGGILPTLQVMEAYLKTTGKLPVNIKLLLEGQEEIGSPDLPEVLQKHKKQLAADFSLSADGGQASKSRGLLALGLRGASAFEVVATTLSKDVHSGTFGGSVQNPNHALSKVIASLHLPNGSVSIPGFYDNVREITDEDKADMAAFTIFDLEEHLGSAGATEAYGEEGFTTLERIWHRPTCDVVGQFGGFTGAGVKTIVPAKATAKIACRLVPDQDPLQILELAKRYVEGLRLVGTHLSFQELHWAAPPYSMSKDALPNRAAAKVLADLGLGSPPLYCRVGGSIPAAAYMQRYLGITMTMFGFGLPSNNIHSPNERYGVEEFLRAQEGYARVLHEVAVMSQLSQPADSRRSEDEL